MRGDDFHRVTRVALKSGASFLKRNSNCFRFFFQVERKRRTSYEMELFWDDKTNWHCIRRRAIRHFHLRSRCLKRLLLVLGWCGVIVRWWRSRSGVSSSWIRPDGWWSHSHLFGSSFAKRWVFRILPPVSTGSSLSWNDVICIFIMLRRRFIIFFFFNGFLSLYRKL